MGESILKKQFKESDVQRMRNLITGKYGDKTSISTGYREIKTDHKEGDIWEENNRKWTIQNGIKQNITKLDAFKEVNIPMFCPSCENIMNKQLDSQYYKMYGSCLNCRTTFETKLKLEGKWEDYQKDLHNKEIDNIIEEYTLWVNSELDANNQGFIAENGDIEKWDGKLDIKRAQEALQGTIDYLNSLKK